MKQSELIEEVASAANITKAKAGDVLACLAMIITEQLQKGECVTLYSSLGVFKAEGKPERTGRNPATGESIVIPAKIKPVFKVSRALKNALNI